MEDQLLFLKKKIYRYRFEVILMCLSLIVLIITAILFYQESSATTPIMTMNEHSSTPTRNIQKVIFVDISGAVKKPNVYKMSQGDRLKQLIDQAGGITDDADLFYFNTHFNLAQQLYDEQKVYIPTNVEITNNLLPPELIMLISSLAPQVNKLSEDNADNQTSMQQNQIDINSASLAELESLPSIGQVSAQKIIDNRPYQSIEELLTREVVGEGTWQKIQDLIK